jgi:hypothetical protein
MLLLLLTYADCAVVCSSAPANTQCVHSSHESAQCNELAATICVRILANSAAKQAKTLRRIHAARLTNSLLCAIAHAAVEQSSGCCCSRLMHVHTYTRAHTYKYIEVCAMHTGEVAECSLSDRGE